MIALRQDLIEARIPWECGECPQEVKTSLGCAPGSKADEPVRFQVGGRKDPKEIEFERCPLAMLRDASPESVAWTDFAIRMSLAKEQGACRIDDGLSLIELDLIHIAEDIRSEVRAERISELGERDGSA